MKGRTVAALAAVLCAASCGERTRSPEASAATPATARANAKAGSELPLADREDFEDASRGFVATDDPLVIRDPAGSVVWDASGDRFLDGPAPPTVNPSLWRQARLDAQHGLFKVADGLYQVRGYDLANMTLVAGRTGWIVVDPLTSTETAAAAIALARRHLGDRPVSAVVFTHSHVDHFGGVGGVLPTDPVARAAIPVIAPAGFMEEATSENMLAGIAMGRRALYMYGGALPRSAEGHVDVGLGKAVSTGTIGIREPTVLVDHTPEEMEIDGVRFVFQSAPESEAPAELTFYLPDRKAWCAADLVTHGLHNLYTLRGAKVRDALRWSGYLDEAIRRFGDMEIVLGGHQWPVWGNGRAIRLLEGQRDAYLYIHDQTLRLANQGYTPREIAEQLELPSTLRTSFANRGYYGTVRHNAKGVYQAYFGWFDANPANLDPLPPVDASRRYVAAMGGAEAVLQKARDAHGAGDDRWAAMLLDHVVFAEPGNAAAKQLLARIYDQLGYRAESGPWRDVYLTGARELRDGVQGTAADPGRAGELLRNTPPDRFLASMAVRLNGPDADGQHMKFNLVFTDVGETHVVEVKNAVLHHWRGEPAADADATVHLTRELLVELATGDAGIRDLVFSDALSVQGSRLRLLAFLLLLDRPDGRFAIVTP